jgi:hypothetical protein
VYVGEMKEMRREKKKEKIKYLEKQRNQMLLKK